MSARTAGRVGPIEKGVVLPPHPTFNGKYPWRSMKVGDSFHVDGVSVQRLGNAARTWAAGRQNGWKFAARTEGKGARVWRIK